MPYTTPFFRQKAILTAVKRKGSPSFKEIKAFVIHKLEEQALRDDKTVAEFSKRTFERDLKDIEQIFGVVIAYSRAIRGYQMESPTELQDAVLEQMLSGFEVLNALKLTQKVAPHIITENKEPQGTEHLNSLLHAIENRLQTEFTHQKYWEDEPTQRTVYPYALKESNFRWYLVARDLKDDKVKTFGLDRISKISISRKNFHIDPALDLTSKFKYSFGIIGNDHSEPEEVYLSFSPFQGKYVKSLPLHPSQQIVRDTNKELCISLRVHPTPDFIMHLLSYGKELTVVQPASLKRRVQEELQLAQKNYKK